MGIIFDIQRCSYQDGPGLRTTVFLKGCQLRCAWCHNPESFRREPQLQFIQHLCSGCGRCADTCPAGAHRFADGVHSLDFARCMHCGRCADSCPTHALKILGYEATAAQVMETVLRDRSFYEASGGGMTVSGGEPTTQPDFLLELLQLAREQGIHTCLETNGYIPRPLLTQLADLVDVFLLDYKITGAQARYTYTHAAGDLWNAALEALQQRGAQVILRLPVIPGINDTEAHFQAAANLKAAYPCIRSLEIMPYHAIGADKWEQLGYSYTLKDLPSATPEQAAAWRAQLRELEALTAPPDSPNRTDLRR